MSWTFFALDLPRFCPHHCVLILLLCSGLGLIVTPSTAKTIPPTTHKANSPPSTKKASPKLQIVARVHLPRGPAHITTWKHYVLIGHLVEGRLTLVDSRKRKVLKSIRLGEGQLRMAVTGSKLWVGLSGSKRLMRLHLPTLKHEQSIPLSFVPYDIQVVPQQQASTPPTSRPSSKPNPSSKSNPSSKPSHKASATLLAITDYLGGRLVYLDPSHPASSRAVGLAWPYLSRWDKNQGAVSSLMGQVYLLRRQDNKAFQVLRCPQPCGGLTQWRGRYLLVYGEAKRGPGSLISFDTKAPYHKKQVHTLARPQSLATTNTHLYILTRQGNIAVHNRHLVQVGRFRVGGAGGSLAQLGQQLLLLLPVERKLLFLSLQNR